MLLDTIGQPSPRIGGRKPAAAVHDDRMASLRVDEHRARPQPDRERAQHGSRRRVQHLQLPARLAGRQPAPGSAADQQQMAASGIHGDAVRTQRHGGSLQYLARSRVDGEQRARVEHIDAPGRLVDVDATDCEVRLLRAIRLQGDGRDRRAVARVEHKQRGTVGNVDPPGLLVDGDGRAARRQRQVHGTQEASRAGIEHAHRAVTVVDHERPPRGLVDGQRTRASAGCRRADESTAPSVEQAYIGIHGSHVGHAVPAVDGHGPRRRAQAHGAERRVAPRINHAEAAGIDTVVCKAAGARVEVTGAVVGVGEAAERPVDQIQPAGALVERPSGGKRLQRDSRKHVTVRRLSQNRTTRQQTSHDDEHQPCHKNRARMEIPPVSSAS